MAKITKKLTGRPATAYKGKYLELKAKYEKLLEYKLGMGEAPEELSAEAPAEATAPQPKELSNPQPSLKSNGEEPISIPEEKAEANLNDTPETSSKDLELVEEEIVVISINKNIIADENIRVKNGVQIVICNTDPYFEIILDFFLKDINKYYDFYHIKYKSLYN